MSDADARLKSFIERVERLEEEKAGIAADIREIYAEAKASGYDPRIMRIIVRLRKMEAEQRAEQEALVEMYEAALASGKSVPPPARTPHDPATGEIIETTPTPPESRAGLTSASGSTQSCGASLATDDTAPDEQGTGLSSRYGSQGPLDQAAGMAEPSSGPVVQCPSSAAPQDPPPPQVHRTVSGEPLKPSIDYEALIDNIPAFLDRTKTQAATA